MDQELLRVERFIEDMKRDGYQADPNPMDRIVEIIRTQPDQIAPLVRALVDELPAYAV